MEEGTLLEYLLGDDDSPWKGVTSISLVLGAANRTKAVAMSEHPNPSRRMVPTEDRIFKGILVKANQKVKQKYGGGQEAFFSEDTIKKMRDRFHASGADKKISVNHEKGDNGYVYNEDCYVAESFIVRNDHDIASLKSQGIEGASKGDWIVGVKVSEDIWENDVKAGEVDGLSLEGFFDSRTVEMSEYQRQIELANKLMDELFK